jgi:hypothetical protein
MIMFGVLWRSIVGTVGGGGVIAAGAVAVVVVLDDESGPEWIAVGFLFGASIGLLLGALAGLVLGLVAARALVPYPGARRCKLVVRLVAMVVVALGLTWWFLESTTWWASLIVLAGIVGAWFVAPFVIAWYVRRMDRTSVDTSPDGDAVPGTA